jgi:hypothetical protein
MTQRSDDAAGAPERDGGQVDGEPVSKPKRVGLFTHFPFGTLATISVTCSVIGVVSLGLEIFAARLLEQPSLGALAGLPLHFVSIPMGVGGVALAGLLFTQGWRAQVVPFLSAAVYWVGVVVWWP